MSYYRRSYYRRQWHVAPPTASEQLRREARQKAGKFVMSKFQNLTPTEFHKFSSWYHAKHGRGAYEYMLRTFHSWKYGSVAMSGQTWARVLAGVPRVMSRNEQFQLLRFYLPYLLSKPRAQFENQTIDSATLIASYGDAAQRISNMTFDLDWFVSAVFSEQEIATLTNIIRYILLRRLESSFSDVRHDLIDLHNTLRVVDADVSVSYRITLLGATVIVSDVNAVATQSLTVTLPALSPEDANHAELRSILADFTLTDALRYHFASGVHALAINDIQKVTAQMKATTTAQEWDSDIAVDCRGGIAQLRVVKMSIQKHKLHIATCYGGMILLILAFFLVARWLSEDHKDAIGLLVIGGFFALGWLGALWQSARERTVAIKNYEQRRSKVFATN